MRTGTSRATVFGGQRATPWYRAGGVPLPRAAYKPMGAPSLPISYINLPNPGVNDAYAVFAGNAPTLTANGWLSDGVRWLQTGVIAEATWTVICRFFGSGTGYKFGSYKVTGTVIQGTNKTAVSNAFWNGTAPLVAGESITEGTVAIAGNTAYVNGVAGGTIAGPANTGLELWIMGLNKNGLPDQRFVGTVAALSIYDSTLTAPEVLALHTAMMALA